MADNDQLQRVIAKYCEPTLGVKVSSLGKGNINETYLVSSPSSSFVLQKINSHVFPSPLKVIQNFSEIADHLQTKKSIEDQLVFAEPVRTLGGELFCRCGLGDWWRAQTYVEHSTVIELTQPVQARVIGEKLGRFHFLLQDMGAEILAEPLPGFHDLKKYLLAYNLLVVTERSAYSGAEEKYCCEMISRYQQKALALHLAFEKGLLSRSVIHGDPKLDNFIFDKTGCSAGLLDLDTVGLGLIPLDIGDCFRSCSNRSGERSTQSLTVDLHVWEQLLGGYFQGGDDSLLADHGRHLFDGLLHICFELGLRFFTDFLDGNTYFRVDDERDNLYKAVSQFQLVEEVVKLESDLCAIAKSVVRLKK